MQANSLSSALIHYINQASLSHRRRKYNLKELADLFLYFFEWKKKLSGYDSLSDKSPWLTFSAIDFLDSSVRIGMKILEFGGGGSTAFFCSKGAAVVTVEHDPKWFEIISRALLPFNTNWKGILLPPERAEEQQKNDFADPFAYISSDAHFKGYSFKRYASYADEYPDDHFDMILIDGRARPSCLIHSLPKVKPGGFLILDNAEREYYLSDTIEKIRKSMEVVIDSIGPGPSSKYFTRTTIWKKNNK